MKKVSEKRSALKKTLKKCAQKVGTAALLFHLGTQSAFWFNEAYHAANPSPQRKAFEQTFGFPIKGWNSSIEEKPERLSELGSVIAQRLYESSSLGPLRHLRLEARPYYKKDIFSQFISVVFPQGGSYLPWMHQITLTDAHRMHETLYHELNHAEVFTLLKKIPQFKEEWVRLSQDEKGKSQYYSFLEEKCSRLIGLRGIIERSKGTAQEKEKKRIHFTLCTAFLLRRCRRTLRRSEYRPSPICS